MPIGGGGGGSSRAVAFRVSRGVAQAIPTGTVTLIEPATVFVDTASRWNAALFRYVPNQAGYWAFGAQLGFAAGVAGTRLTTRIQRNGVSLIESQERFEGVNAQFTNCEIFAVLMNGTTDYVDWYGYQETGAPQNTSTNSQNQFFGFFIGRQ